jgi:ATP-binding cassette subfamily B protein/ATP-binding cassette subfamily C protein
MSKKTVENKEITKVSAGEFFKIAKWAVGIVFQIGKFPAILFIVTSTIGKLLLIAWTYIFSRILDWIIFHSNNPNNFTNDDLKYPIYLLGVFTLATFVNNVLGRYARTEIRMYTRIKFRSLYVNKLNELGIQTLEQPEINNKMHRSQDAVPYINEFYFGLVNVLTEIVRLISASIIIFRLDPIISLAVFLATLPYLVFDKKMRAKIYEVEYTNTEKSRLSYFNVWDISDPKSLSEIYITGSFNFLHDKYITFQYWLMDQFKNINHKWNIGQNLLEVGRNIVIYATYINLFVDAIKKVISIGDLTFSIRTIDMFRDSIQTVTTSANELLEQSFRFKDMRGIFDAQPIVNDGDIKMEKLNTGPEIEFSNVSFAYPNTKKNVLEDITLHIKSGEKIAIVGHNGAGKTTLAKLINRFYRPTKGDILINDTNLNNLQIDSFYQNVGVLWQEFNKYEQLSVAENVYIGNTSDKPDLKRVVSALKEADAFDFVNSYPNKLDTILTERIKGGIRPSTGQWQKIAIARFFYRNAPLIIFDEPTASIDAQSEYNIFKNIYEFFTGKTVIIISHRFSTVRNADRILVMDHGRIIEDGSHDELMALGGKYSEAFKLQAEGYKENISKIV